MFARPLTLLFYNVLVCFGVSVFCRLLKENCGLNVEDTKKSKKGISGAGIERNTLLLEHKSLTLKPTCAWAWTSAHEHNCTVKDLKPKCNRVNLGCKRPKAQVRSSTPSVWSSALVRRGSTETLIFYNKNHLFHCKCMREVSFSPKLWTFVIFELWTWFHFESI